jgi:ubiquinone biosynthesis protein Coq4
MFWSELPWLQGCPAEGLGALFSSELSTVNVKVDESKIVSDVRDEAHLNARRATRGK